MARYYLYSSLLIIALLTTLALSQLSTPSPKEVWHTPIFIATSLNLLCRQARTDPAISPQVWKLILDVAERDLSGWQPASGLTSVKAGLQRDIEQLRTVADKGNIQQVVTTCETVKASLGVIYEQAKRDGMTEEEMGAVFEGVVR